MKVLKDNLFNRIFRGKRLQEQQRKFIATSLYLEKATGFERAIVNCDSLLKMLSIHKDMWGSGFKDNSIGPDHDGMFRCEDIPSMKPEEVFLGNIYDLWTLPIPEWESQRNALIGENSFLINPGTTVYQIILDQYRGVLLSNLRYMTREKRRWLEAYNNGWLYSV